MMMKFHRKFAIPQSVLLRLYLQKTLEKFTTIVVRTENNKGRARSNGGKDLNKIFIFTHLLIQDPHDSILVQKVLCIIRKYIDLSFAASDYLCIDHYE